jgi:hypothetical protein
MTRTFERNTSGLRDALMSEMEDIRAGIATPAEATAFALLAKTIVSSMEAEITESLRLDAKEERDRRYKEREHNRLLAEKEVLALEHTPQDEEVDKDVY